MQTSLEWQKADQQLPGGRSDVVAGGRDYKVQETLRDDESVHYLDSDDSFSGVVYTYVKSH